MTDYVASITGFVTAVGTAASGFLGMLNGLGATVVGFIVVGLVAFYLFKRFF